MSSKTSSLTPWFPTSNFSTFNSSPKLSSCSPSSQHHFCPGSRGVHCWKLQLALQSPQRCRSPSPINSSSSPQHQHHCFPWTQPHPPGVPYLPDILYILLTNNWNHFISSFVLIQLPSNHFPVLSTVESLPLTIRPHSNTPQHNWILSRKFLILPIFRFFSPPLVILTQLLPSWNPKSLHLKSHPIISLVSGTLT